MNIENMKKNALVCVGLCIAMAFTGCKSSESAYKQAYLKAKAQEEAQQAAAQQENNVVVPLEEKSTANTQVTDNADNVPVRQENVNLVSGSGLRAYSVVVGSFGLRANADGLQQTLRNAGYDAQVVVNNNVSPVMYRVVATTFDSKADAVASRNQLSSQYQGAWLLYAQ